jgi:putative CocE/NonD family hydrolase
VREDDLDRLLEIEHVWIPVSDGCRLSARLWMPRSAETEPVPAILEYIPYRKRDFTRARDEPIHRYFALGGYACVRVDVRGSGDSEGVLRDEYSDQELRDAVEALAWIADQPWCNGAVGMMGISWGGFNSLQVAALDPPQLRAIITLCSTDDRYADDAHYMGGCLLNENLQWGSILTLYSALPPDPAIVGEPWRKMWLERLEALEPFPALWMEHPWRDAYWKRGSVCEDYAAIRCPVYAIGGWADGYSNAVPRLLENLSCPKKGLVGPWAHAFPHDGLPGPRIGFLQEALRWWDHWLKGRDTGIMDEPVYRVWMQEGVAPAPQYEERPGRWVAEASWPSPRIEHRRLHLDPGRLTASPGRETQLSFSSPQTTGMRGGEWCPFGAEGEMPRDQRPDDGFSLCFDSDPLEERVEILGAPALDLDVRVDQPVAWVAARLNDVAPDGSSLRVTYGLLNLAQRESREHPEPLEPERWYRVRLRLDDVAHAFAPGHRLRVALSTCYWPVAWPAPQPVRLTLRTGSSVASLPVRPPRDEDRALPAFELPAAAPGVTHKRLRPLAFRRTLETDLTTGELVYTLHSDAGDLGGAALARIEPIDLDLGYTLEKRYRILEEDPLSAQAELLQRARMRRDGWDIRIECRSRLAATHEDFEFACELEALEAEHPVARRSWKRAIPRRLL